MDSFGFIIPAEPVRSSWIGISLFLTLNHQVVGLMHTTHSHQPRPTKIGWALLNVMGTHSNRPRRCPVHHKWMPISQNRQQNRRFLALEGDHLPPLLGTNQLLTNLLLGSQQHCLLEALVFHLWAILLLHPRHQ